MEFILFGLALAFLFLAGIGFILIISPDAEFMHLLGYSFPLGCALISGACFALGPLLRGMALLTTISVIAIVFAAAGIKNRYLQDSSTAEETHDLRWLGLVAVQLAFITWISFSRPLGWDALLIFELKAWLAFLNGGAAPAAYYQDAFRLWSHPTYPLLLPLSECWLYLWLGRADQQMVKIIFPLFFVSGLALHHLSARRRGQSIFLAPLLMLTIPYLWFGIGSIASGYSDYPLAVFYLGAIVALLEYEKGGTLASLATAGAMLAAGCFLKREGAVLWFWASLIGIGGIFLDRQKAVAVRLQRCLLLVLPGLLSVGGWKIYLHEIGALPENEYLPVTPAAIQANLGRIPSLLMAIFGELMHWKYWGPFWLLVALALMRSVWRRKHATLALSFLGPFLTYCTIYLFSAWGDWRSHFESSFSRLLLHLSPVAMLLVAACASGFNKRFSDSAGKG